MDKLNDFKKYLTIGRVLYNSCNDNLYNDLTKEELFELKKFLKDNPTSLLDDEGSLKKYKNIVIDFKEIKPIEVLTNILKQCNEDFNYDELNHKTFSSFKNQCIKNKLYLQICLFNLNSITIDENEKINNIFLFNSKYFNTQVFLEGEELLQTQKTSEGREIKEGENYRIFGDNRSMQGYQKTKQFK